MSILHSVGSILARIDRASKAGQLLQVADGTASLMLTVCRLHRTHPPATPLDREQWASDTGPLIHHAKRILDQLERRPGPVGPWGVSWDWKPTIAALGHLVACLRPPGPDDLYTAVPATVPPPAPGGVVGASPSAN